MNCISSVHKSNSKLVNSVSFIYKKTKPKTKHQEAESNIFSEL